MRRIAQFIILIVLLLVSTNSQYALNQTPINHTDSNVSVGTIKPQQDVFTDLSRPILVNVTDKAAESTLINPLKDRNDTLGNGAIYASQVNHTMRVEYAVVNSNSGYDLRLYADAPYTNQTGAFTLDRAGNVNESISMIFLYTVQENITLPYNGKEIVNATVGYYYTYLNITSDYLRFYAAMINGYSETDSNSPYNMFTTDLYWTTTSQDEFYIQDDPVLINLVANQTDINYNVFGVNYQIMNDTVPKPVDLNFTTGVSTNFETQLDLGAFPINNTIMWRSYVYVNDTARNMERKIDGVEIKFVNINDGTPALQTFLASDTTFSVLQNVSGIETLYTQNNVVNFSISATVPKGEISKFNLELGANLTTVLTTGNVSTQGDFYNFTHTFGAEGKYNVSIEAVTNKNLTITERYLVVYDNTPPTADFASQFTDQEITAFDPTVTLAFSYSDENAGVFVASVDFGNGYSQAVTDKTNVTYSYLGVNQTTTYQVALTVMDHAGNSYIAYTTVTIHPAKLHTLAPPPTETIIFWVLLVGGVLVYVFRGRIWKS